MIKFKFFAREGTKQNTANAAPETSAEAPSTPLNGKHVLVVDDDRVFLQATSMKLRAAGYEVSTATENSEALSVAGERSVDAVLMDINFPPDVCNGGMGSWDGFQIMGWMRGLPQINRAKFFLVSQTDSPAYRERSRVMGAKAFLPKPLDHATLLEMLSADS